jgi:hypothetical protein
VSTVINTPKATETQSATEEESFGQPDSVEQCLAILSEVGEEQRGRSRHLDTKAASIAGFAGTALTLNLTLGRPLLQQHFAGHAWAHGVIRDAFICSAAMFALAALAAIVGVLRPTGTKDLDEEAIDGYANRPKVIAPPPKLRETWLQTMAEMTLADRKAGNAKATWATVAVVLLGIGILGLLAQAVTLGVAS